VDNDYDMDSTDKVHPLANFHLFGTMLNSMTTMYNQLSIVDPTITTAKCTGPALTDTVSEAAALATQGHKEKGKEPKVPHFKKLRTENSTSVPAVVHLRLRFSFISAYIFPVFISKGAKSVNAKHIVANKGETETPSSKRPAKRSCNNKSISLYNSNGMCILFLIFRALLPMYQHLSEGKIMIDFSATPDVYRMLCHAEAVTEEDTPDVYSRQGIAATLFHLWTSMEEIHHIFFAINSASVVLLLRRRGVLLNSSILPTLRMSLAAFLRSVNFMRPLKLERGRMVFLRQRTGLTPLRFLTPGEYYAQITVFTF
jgi:hypothetical protein